MTRPYAEVIGDPIAHSKSPLIHNFWLAKLGIDAEYRACHVLPEELEDYFTRRRGDTEWRGCNVTIPHKVATRSLVDEIHDDNIGAINCVSASRNGLIGNNTDSTGVLVALDRHIDTIRPTCIIGAGGAARAAIAGLDHYAVFDFRIISRDRAKGQSLLDEFGMAGAAFTLDEAAQALRGSHGVINASPLGMMGFAPMPASVLDGLSGITRRGGFAFDMVYAPLRTPFLEAAERARLRTVDGLVMLVGQAAAAFEMFFGQPAPRKHDAELRALLTQ